jgi:hypothetical protein
MNVINKRPLSDLGYNFIPTAYIPKGKTEYYLRDKQNRSGIEYRSLKDTEKKILIQNGNSSDNWEMILVSASFDPRLVKNCIFHGLVRIGKLEPFFHEFNNLRMPVGLYNSTIISCDFGDNVVVDNVNFISHYIIGNEVMLANINELATTDHSKFGNGVLKEGETESVRIWLELCNENGGRSVLPFNGMTAADAWLWSKYRDNEKLLQRFKEFTDNKYDTHRGYYGKIGDRSVIKNCRIIKDVWIGTDAYVKGANKLKNLTIDSNESARSQIGEGCELVNGIIGVGCRIFYGVKAVRFVMGTHSQLKYGARLINSYLGENSTISCCEVLNSLIFPGHEQHHNNSFLCAATVLGQSNMAAGATIGSNHNSRGADGEIVAGRGFWPGLCVSLKHNSRFASFTLIAKSDYPCELNIPIPFSLVSNDVSADRLQVLPGYWFMHNLYALTRNAGKYVDRDKRLDKSIYIEYDFLAPDTVNEIFNALRLLKKFTGTAHASRLKKQLVGDELVKTGESLLENHVESIAGLEIFAEGFENSQRPVLLLKVAESYAIFKELIIYYAVIQIMAHIDRHRITSWEKLNKSLPEKTERAEWTNAGGQLIPSSEISQLLKKITTGKLQDWDEVHEWYKVKSKSYPADKFRHSFSSLLEILKIPRSRFTKKLFLQLLQQALSTKEWMFRNIEESRAKDYTNPFRRMVYDNEKEMANVIGDLESNSFIKDQREQLVQFRAKITELSSII